MKHLTLWLVRAAGLGFAAGGVVGRAIRPDPVRSEPKPESEFARRLNLTDEQHKKMREIWDDAMKKSGPPPFDQMRKCSEERDQAIQDLLSTEQKAGYEQIQNNYRSKMDALHAESNAARAQAVELTRQLLNDQQRAEYDKMTRERESGRRGGPGGGPPGRYGPDSRRNGERR
jgi:Spy/CpxP family protein refolding chaperone